LAAKPQTLTIHPSAGSARNPRGALPLDPAGDNVPGPRGAALRA
jgi:hypothetical protein